MIEHFKDVVKQIEERYRVRLTFGPKNTIQCLFAEELSEEEQRLLKRRIYRDVHHARQEAKKWKHSE